VEVGEMKKGIMVLLALGAVAAWGADLNTEHVRAGATNFDPSGITGDDEFRKIWENATAICYQLSLIWTDDSQWWEYPNGVHKLYPYTFYRFDKPESFDGGTCYWEVKADSYAPCYAYHWNPNSDAWVPHGNNGGGASPPKKSFYVGTGSNFWTTDDKLYVMVVVKTASSPSGWAEWTDVCEVIW
jgi:hypothetical protein